MLTTEFEELSGCPATEYEAANELYIMLPNLSKQDFCLLWGIYGADLAQFKTARRVLELAHELHEIQQGCCLRADSAEKLAHDTLMGIEAQLHSLAYDVRAELLKPCNWNRRTVAALRKMEA